MNYAEWLVDVPSEITNDPIWKLEVYRLGLFAGDIGWQDVHFLAKKPLMLSVADQLHRSIDSISVNLTEGYSRSKGPDRARFIEASLGSARESREWYYKSRHVFPAEVIKHRMGLTTRIVSMLAPMFRINVNTPSAKNKSNTIHNLQTSCSTRMCLFHNPSFPPALHQTQCGASVFRLSLDRNHTPLTHFLLSTNQNYGVHP